MLLEATQDTLLAEPQQRCVARSSLVVYLFRMFLGLGPSDAD
jgi:hypothetical protein